MARIQKSISRPLRPPSWPSSAPAEGGRNEYSVISGPLKTMMRPMWDSLTPFARGPNLLMTWSSLSCALTAPMAYETVASGLSCVIVSMRDSAICVMSEMPKMFVSSYAVLNTEGVTTNSGPPVPSVRPLNVLLYCVLRSWNVAPGMSIGSE